MGWRMSCCCCCVGNHALSVSCFLLMNAPTWLLQLSWWCCCPGCCCPYCCCPCCCPLLLLLPLLLLPPAAVAAAPAAAAPCCCPCSCCPCSCCCCSGCCSRCCNCPAAATAAACCCCCCPYCCCPCCNCPCFWSHSSILYKGIDFCWRFHRPSSSAIFLLCVPLPVPHLNLRVFLFTSGSTYISISVSAVCPRCQRSAERSMTTWRWNSHRWNSIQFSVWHGVSLLSLIQYQHYTLLLSYAAQSIYTPNIYTPPIDLYYCIILSPLFFKPSLYLSAFRAMPNTRHYSETEDAMIARRLLHFQTNYRSFRSHKLSEVVSKLPSLLCFFLSYWSTPSQKNDLP